MMTVKARDAAARAEARKLWVAALPVQAMRALRAAGLGEAARVRWIKGVAPRIDAWDAVDMATDYYIDGGAA